MNIIDSFLVWFISFHRFGRFTISKSRLDPSELTVNVKYDIEQYTIHIWYDHNYSFATGPSSQHC